VAFGSGGLGSVSDMRAEKIWGEMFLHDDGITGHGGTNCMVVGSQGSGKTTVGLTAADSCYYLPWGNKDQINLSNYRKLQPDEIGAKPETVIWMGSHMDYYNLWVPENYRRAYGHDPRPMRVHVSRGDQLHFYERDQKGMREIRLTVAKYRNPTHLFMNLVRGGINVIYPPEKYVLSQTLKDVLNARMMLSEDSSRYYQKDQDYAAQPWLFLYELFGYLYGTRGAIAGREWFSLFIDEAHRYFPISPPGALWHLVAYASDEMADTRRANLSVFAFVHGMKSLDFRILPRFGYFEWMTGSRPDPAYSRVSPHLISELAKWNEKSVAAGFRWAINERRREFFGKHQIMNIPWRPGLLIARYAEIDPDEDLSFEVDPGTPSMEPVAVE